MDPRLLEVVVELAEITGAWEVLGEIMKRAIRGTATAIELQVLVEKIDELQNRTQEVTKKNDELIRS